ncbi:MAG: DUF6473 family protein [Rhodobacter sp.]|nr:DUF6473 family protein [Rhodobacter sp.]
MSYQNLGQADLDYFPCRYGTSKLLFRGPRRRLRDNYVAYLGGIETYGRFIQEPYPTLSEHESGVKSVNLGCVNAGVDAYVTDKSLIDICAKARVTVIQMVGAQNMSNRFYAVHPRRNDRFLRASSLLQTIYSGVDFTDFNFTRHMLTVLAETSAQKFAMVEAELKDAWVGRMKTLIEQINGNVVLLWLADHTPEQAAERGMAEAEPLFVDRAMIDALSGLVSNVVEIVSTPAERRSGLDEMAFAPLEQPAAEEMLGPVVHRRVAATLAPIIRSLI